MMRLTNNVQDGGVHAQYSTSSNSPILNTSWGLQIIRKMKVLCEDITQV